jgi:hypothetical protein
LRQVAGVVFLAACSSDVAGLVFGANTVSSMQIINEHRASRQHHDFELVMLKWCSTGDAVAACVIELQLLRCWMSAHAACVRIVMLVAAM